MADSKKKCGAMSRIDGDTAKVTYVHVCTTHTHAYTHACMHVRFRVGTSGANNASARRPQNPVFHCGACYTRIILLEVDLDHETGWAGLGLAGYVGLESRDFREKVYES
jgi:hypothetical protein